MADKASGRARDPGLEAGWPEHFSACTCGGPTGDPGGAATGTGASVQHMGAYCWAVRPLPSGAGGLPTAPQQLAEWAPHEDLFLLISLFPLQMYVFQQGASNVPKLGHTPGPNSKGGQKNPFLTSALASLASQSGKFPARNGAGQAESTSSAY